MSDPLPPAQEPNLECVFAADQVRARIRALADELLRVYQSRDLLVVAIAEGARRFADALVEELEVRWLLPQVLYVRARRTKGTGLEEVQVEHVDPTEFQDRDVLILDDIADEGRTLDAVLQLVQEGEPRSVECGVLVSKHLRRRVKLPIRFVCFELERGWAVGFGMDLDGKYRDLDHIAIVPGTD